MLVYTVVRPHTHVVVRAPSAARASRQLQLLTLWSPPMCDDASAALASDRAVLDPLGEVVVLPGDWSSVLEAGDVPASAACRGRRFIAGAEVAA